jgi:hypothetical protein
VRSERQVATGSAKSRRARESRCQAVGIAIDSSHAKKNRSARATFRGAKPITRVMDERERSDLTGRLRKAAEKMPYPYFLLRLEDIEAWLKAGYSVKSVWRIYCEKSVPFPGSYRSFLRYCRERCESAPPARRRAPKAPKAAPRRPVSVLGQTRFPPPLDRPPGLTREQIDSLMDPDRHLDPKR